MLLRRISAPLRTTLRRGVFCTLLLASTAPVVGAHAEAPPPTGVTPPLPPPAPVQVAQAPRPLPPATLPVTAAPVASSVQAAPRDVRSDAECEPKRHTKMNDYAFGVQLGVGRVSAGDVANPTYTPALLDLANQLTPAQMQQAGLITTGCSPLDSRCTTDARTGVQLSFPVQLGGAGVGFKVEPMFNLAKAAKSYGLYVGPTFNYRVLDPLYLGFGLGIKAAWVNADGWKYGGDFQGRIPVTGTVYLNDDVALVLEFAYGGGVSVFANDPRVVRNPLTGAVIDSKTPEATFGLGRAWDLTLGVRFP